MAAINSSITMEQGKYSIRLSVLKALKEIYKAGSYDDFFQGM